MIVLDGAIDNLRDEEFGKVAACLLRRLFNDFKRVNRVFRRADRIENDTIANRAGELQADRRGCRNIERNMRAHRLPTQTDVIEINEFTVIRNFLPAKQ